MLTNRFITLDEIKKYEKIIYKTRSKLTLFEALTMIYLMAADNQKNSSYNLVEDWGWVCQRLKSLMGFSKSSNNN